MEDTPIPGYRYLVTNRERLGGKPTIRGTRFSASFILACLAEGMSYEDIVREYSDFPRESIAEVLRFAAEVTDRLLRYGGATQVDADVTGNAAITGDSWTVAGYNGAVRGTVIGNTFSYTYPGGGADVTVNAAEMRGTTQSGKSLLMRRE